MTPEQKKAMALMDMRRRMSESQGVSESNQPAASDVMPQPAESDQPYYRAPDFAGQSYFDERRSELESQLETLTREHREWKGLPIPPFAPSQLPWSQEEKEYRKQSGEIKQNIQSLGEDEKAWGKGFPEELRALPEISSSQAVAGGTTGKKYGAVLLMDLLAPEDKDKVGILENAGFSVEMVNGFPKITNPDTGQEFSLNKPGFSSRDFGDFLAKAIQFIPAAKATSTIGGTGTKAIIKRAVAGAGLSAFTEAGAQGLEAALGGEYDGSDVTVAGLFGGAGEVAIPLLKPIWNKLSGAGRERLLRATSMEDIQQLGVGSKEELAAIEKMLVEEGSTIAEVPPLNRPQTTGSAQDTGRLYAAAKDPEIAERIARENSRRDVWAKSRLDKATEGATLEDALRNARDASEGIFENLYASRKVEANKLYGEAFENAGNVNLSGLRQRIKTIVEDESIKGGEKDRILRLVGKYLDTAKKEPTTPLARRLAGAKGPSANDTIPAKLAQELKFEIDNLIEKRGMTAVGQNTEGALLSVQSELKHLIEEAAPGYKNANMAFKAATENIDVMQQDLIGLISAKNDSNLETIRRMMDSKDVPRLLKVKGLLDASGDQSIWAGLWRDWLKGKADKLPSNLMDKANPAEVMFNKMFGQQGSMNRIMELAPDTNSRRNMMWLRDYLQKSMKARGFSEEATSQALAEKQIQGGFRAGLARLLHSSRQTIAEGAIGTGEKKRMMAIFEAMEGPQWVDRMKEIRGAIGLEQQTNLMSKLIDDILRVSAQGSRTDLQDEQSTQ